MKFTDCIFTNKLIKPSGVLRKVKEVNSTQIKNSSSYTWTVCILFYSLPYVSTILHGGRQWNNPHCSNSPAVSVYTPYFNALQLPLDSVLTKFTDCAENGFLQLPDMQLIWQNILFAHQNSAGETENTAFSVLSFQQSAVQGLWLCILPLTCPTSKKNCTDSHLVNRKPWSWTESHGHLLIILSWKMLSKQCREWFTKWAATISHW